jgi:ribonuclease P protein component
VGRKEFARFSVIFVAPNELGHPRLGITVTRKAGKSHVRNRLRRWVREVYRRSRDEIGLEGHSVDIVVNVKPAAAGSEFGPFADDLRKVLGRAGRIPRA